MEKLAAEAKNKVKVLMASRTESKRLGKEREIGGGFLLSFGITPFPCLPILPTVHAAIGLLEGMLCPDQLFIELMQLTDL